VSPATVRRTTARVVPVNGQGEALLMLSCDPANPELTYWCSFGGAVDEGESRREAGARELREETWLVVGPAELESAVNNERLAAFVRAAVSHLGLSA
jgi:8-oxo-dGTP pyrophosphatase MutT (NUDIX family)